MTAPTPAEKPATARAPDAGPAALLAVVEATLRDLHPGATDLPPVAPASVLDQDLGFDSLARMELLLRTERAFGVDLPAETLQRAETVADVWSAVQQGLARGGASTTAAAARGPQPPAGQSLSSTPADLSPGEPTEATTLLQVLDWHLAAHPEQTQIVVLGEGGETGEGAEQAISYRQLAEASAAVAASLQRTGVVPRQSVAIMLPTCADYFSTYFGILRAGAIPVPIYPPARASQLEDHVLRHTGIQSNAQAVLMVTVPEAMPVARLLQARVPGLRHVVTPQELALAGEAPTSVQVR
ncbi:MAG TPA: AMP-binding protein, partial [Rubrivivax sp.]|nr:AMP-binding protein [Rubrivivax sp.]